MTNLKFDMDKSLIFLEIVGKEWQEFKDKLVEKGGKLDHMYFGKSEDEIKKYKEELKVQIEGNKTHTWD
ncbi:hypothetical protein ACFL1H_08045 [Nanoarchaeota archaeon]